MALECRRMEMIQQLALYFSEQEDSEEEDDDIWTVPGINTQSASCRLFDDPFPLTYVYCKVASVLYYYRKRRKSYFQGVQQVDLRSVGKRAVSVAAHASIEGTTRKGVGGSGHL